MINEVPLLSCADSGASITAISRSMAEESGLTWTPRNMGLQLAVSDHPAETLGFVETDIQVLTKSPINVKGITIWVVDQDMQEVLLGDDLLCRLGINVRHLLEDKGGVTLDYPTGEIVSQYPYLGGEDAGKIKAVLLNCIHKAEQMGLPADRVDKWTSLLMLHLNEFRMTLSHDPKAQLPDMKVHFDPLKAEKVRPVRIAYTLAQERFMDYYVKKLIDHGYVYENPNARWVSESLVISKVKNPTILEEDFRLVVNLKRANAACEPIYWPLPTFEEIQRHLHGARYFITMDLKNGYWQIGLDSASQELFSFCTHRQVVTPCRIPQGSTDAVMFFTHLMMKTFEERIYNGIVPWLDDLLLYSATISELYDLLEWVLQKAAKVGLKFSPNKLVLFAQEIKWCGKIITPEGIKVDPMRIEALVNMPVPTNAAQLMQFVNASNWIRTSIINYSTIFEPLYIRLNTALGNGKRTKNRATRIPMLLSDDEAFITAFQQAKMAIANSICLAHPNMGYTFVLMTDASDFAWGSVLFQLPIWNEGAKLSDQENIEPLSMLSGVFRDAQVNWSTPEKEAFAIVESVERLRYFLIRPTGFYILTDHRNLLFSYDPLSVKRLNARARIDRWVLKLEGYKYQVQHIAGADNIWSDLLSRWGAQPLIPSIPTMYLRRIIPRHLAQPVTTPYNLIEFPTRQDLLRMQTEVTTPSNIHGNDQGVLVNLEGKTWVPAKARISILTVAHYGISGHYGIRDTLKRLQEKFYWKNMAEDTKLFIIDCILCRCAKMVSPTRIHLGIGQRPTKPNQTLHFDYFYVGRSDVDFSYLLVLRDGFSRFVMVFPCINADSQTAVKYLLQWIALFGIPDKFFSDNGPHFRNKTMQELARRLNVIHDFSTVYCAWANGFIERVLRDLKALMKIMVHETNTDMKQWPVLCPNIMLALNQRPSESLSGFTPLAVHTGLKETNALDFYFDTNNEYQDAVWTPNMEKHLENLSNVLDFVHKSVYEATKRISERSRKKAMPLPLFEIGDYVLYCFVDRNQSGTSKLHFQWLGPFQIVDTKSLYVYFIKDLVGGKILEVHIDRLSFFSTAQLHVTGDLLDFVSREGLEYEIQELVDIIWDSEKRIYVVKTLWSGFRQEEATFEPFRSLIDQVPLLVLNFLNDLFLKGDKKKVQRIFVHERKYIFMVIKRHSYEIKSFDFIR